MFLLFHLLQPDLSISPSDPWEFPKEQLRFIKKLGSGAFGQVWLAEALGILSMDSRNNTSEASKRRQKMKRKLQLAKTHRREIGYQSMFINEASDNILVAVKTLKGNVYRFSNDICSILH